MANPDMLMISCVLKPREGRIIKLPHNLDVFPKDGLLWPNEESWAREDVSLSPEWARTVNKALTAHRVSLEQEIWLLREGLDHNPPKLSPPSVVGVRLGVFQYIITEDQHSFANMHFSLRLETAGSELMTTEAYIKRMLKYT